MQSKTSPPPRDLNLADASSPYAALSVDTSLFPAAFQARVLSELSQHFSDGLDAHLNGTLIHADNFQALNLLQARYREQVKCIYIDPPYNTSASEIIYKNSYKHSSWLTLIDNRMSLSKKLMNPHKGVLCGTIDDVEQKIFSQVLESYFGEISGTVSIRIKPSGRPIPNGFALSHEYAIFAKANPEYPIARLAHNNEQKARYREADDKGAFFWEMFRKAGSNSNRENRPTMFYPFYLNKDNQALRLPAMVFDETKSTYTIQEQPEANEIAIYPIKDDGTDGCWYFGLERALTIPDEFQARLQEDGSYRIYYRRRPNEGIQPTSLWFDSKYSATEHGTALLKNLFGSQEVFSYPKSIYAVIDCLTVMGTGIELDAICLDYFAGSGTTAHAVINLNRDDGGNRKYILVEQGEYFDTVLKPRVQKVIYAENWKDGKPMPSEKNSRSAEANTPLSDGINSETAAYVLNTPHNGVSQIVKVLRLESYEDCLNNLALHNPNGDLFATLPEQARRDYVLRYMLDVESRGSLLNVAHFERPFDYVMEIATDSAGASVPTRVDLVETFNYLLGLSVVSIDDRRFDRGYVLVTGWQPNHAADETTLILWRDCVRWPDDKLTELLEKLAINPQENEFAAVYVNGDHTLTTAWSNADGESGRLKIRQTEAAFLDLMFEGNV